MARRLCKEFGRKLWVSEWDTAPTARVVRQFMPGPSKTDPWRRLNRRDQSAIFGLRTGHCGLNEHLARIIPHKEVNCQRCGSSSADSTEHFLLFCPTLRSLRERFLPRVSSLKVVLWGSFEQLQRTARFYRLGTGADADPRAGSARPV